VSDGTTDIAESLEAQVADMGGQFSGVDGTWPCVVVSGAMSAGKAQLLAALLRELSATDRLVDVAEDHR
jgi:tRNA A37 threonylcarbamoyladenosine biosynthesis protein TsaE